MSKKLFVGNLSFQTTESDITAAFETFGSIESVVLVDRQVQGQNRTYRYRVHYAQGSLFLICSLDGSGMIQGIWYESDTAPG